MDENNTARIEQLLEETLELAEENNRLLLSIQRTGRWAFWGKLLFWVIILVLPLIFIGPILDAILPVPLSEAGSGSVFGLPSAEQLQILMEAYGAGAEAP